MIYVTDIRHLPVNDSNFECWAIVRSWKGGSNKIKHVPELSPSWELFKQYLNLAKAGNWNEQTFRTIYLPWFLREMRESTARTALNRLYALDKAGKNIALACFCSDEALCHRSIVAGLLQGVGSNVHTLRGMNYSEYFKMYKTV